MEKMQALFKALSDKTRLRIMGALIRAGRALCICEITDALGLPQYTVSKHVRELKIAGLVREEKAGKFVFYSLAAAADDFHRRLQGLLRASLAGAFAEDSRRLDRRLALREGGRCVVGMKKGKRRPPC